MRLLRLPLYSLLLALACVATTRADTTFDLNGTFQSGGTVRGTVTIDTAAGLVTNSALTVNADGLLFALDVPPTGQGPDLGSYYQFDYTFSLPTTSGNGLSFSVPQVSLLSYGGGPLCSSVVPCLANQSNLLFTLTPSGGRQVIDFLAVGSLSAVPEPASWTLLSLAMLATATVAGARRLRRPVHCGGLSPR